MADESALTAAQQAAAAATATTTLIGPAGTGKTTALHYRLLRLLQAGEPAYTILTLVADDEGRQQFLDFLHEHRAGAYADLKLTTYPYLAREMVSLFWPLVARRAGFARPFQPPTFLSYDLAQLMMWRLVGPMLDQGAFANLRLRPQQIVSQLLDTLNRAALNRLTLDQARQRQIDSWAADPEDVRNLQEASRAAKLFRAQCRRRSLLDMSLVVRVFDTQVVTHPEFIRYFHERFRHLVVDNVEEQTPAGQHFITALMDSTETTTVAYDAGGGYKRFLSADPVGAQKVSDLNAHRIHFEERFTSSEALVHLANHVHNRLLPSAEHRPASEATEAIISVVSGRYRRDMVQRLVPRLGQLIRQKGIAPNQIALVTPYLDAALRYMLEQAMRDADIPYTLLRRRSSPRDEPRVRAWLTWLALAHPEWELSPTVYDVAEALTLSMEGLDAIRAHLLSENLYLPEVGQLLPTSELPTKLMERIGPDQAERVDVLRDWLANSGELPLDTFLHRLFNNLLARPPFQSTPDVAGAAVSDWLVRTAGSLREAAPAMEIQSPSALGRTFVEGINKGLVTADPPQLGEPPDPDGVIIATMYGYLLTGGAVNVQVWLDAAATGWWDIPRQPLSNAFVLAQSWPEGSVWTMEADYHMRNRLLSRLVQGLVARCRTGIILANSDLDRRGQRQDGPLWRAVEPLLASELAV